MVVIDWCYSEGESEREGEIKQLTNPEEEDSVAVVQRSNVTASTLMRDLRLKDDLIDHFLNKDHFVLRASLHKMEAVMAQCEEVYKDIQNEAKLLKTISLFSMSSVSLHRYQFYFSITLTSFGKDY